MPRVHHIKARKDYPNDGIKKGDMYYKWSIKTGPVSGITFRSPTPPKPSQLTNSAFYQEYYAIQEQFDEIMSNAEVIEDDLNNIRDNLENLRDDTQDKLDNMPEGLQEGNTGQLLQERIDALEQDISEIEDIINQIEDDDFDFEEHRDFSWNG